MRAFWQRLKRSSPSEPPLSSASEPVPSTSWAWVLPHKLAVGSFPDPADLDLLKCHGIQAILTLCTPEEAALDPAFLEAFYCLQYSLPDSRQSKPFLTKDLSIAVELLHQTLTTQGITYVHCLAGVERSPTVCIAYLCRYHHFQVWEALNWMKNIHARTGITSEQLRSISDYLAEDY